MPEVGPEGMDGVVGALFDGPVMETDSGFDQSEDSLWLSVDLARTLKVVVDPAGTLQL